MPKQPGTAVDALRILAALTAAAADARHAAEAATTTAAAADESTGLTLHTLLQPQHTAQGEVGCTQWRTVDATVGCGGCHIKVVMGAI